MGVAVSGAVWEASAEGDISGTVRRPDFALERAVQALAEGRLADAEAAFSAILAGDPDHAMANYGLKDVVRLRIVTGCAS